MFIDSAKIYIRAGSGGNGAVSFHREKYIAAGGPDGGDGGKGGDVIFIVDSGIRTLADFRYKRKYTAENGQNGSGGKCTGRGGEDLLIMVPPGTVIIDDATDLVLADLTEEKERRVIAKGGRGGAGNQHFATSTRQIPNFAKPGESGQEYMVRLELKLLADVGLIGFPNVGKSTLLSAVTQATPKIADYHFTTITPNLGVVSVDENKSFVMADIPGLIEGAHGGAGLGHEFLKHIERSRILIHVVDVAGSEGREPLLDFDIINHELAEFNPKLATKPQIVAANKTDLTGAEEKLAEFAEDLKKRGYEVFAISGATGKGVRELMLRASELLDKLPQGEAAAPYEMAGRKIYTAEAEIPFTIKTADGKYIVEGEWIKKLVYSTNIDSYDSLQYFQRAIKSKGLIEALEKAGINEGDTVSMYGMEFDYRR